MDSGRIIFNKRLCAQINPYMKGQRSKGFFRCFAKLGKSSVSFIMSVNWYVCQSVCPCKWNSSAPTEWNFMTFDI